MEKFNISEKKVESLFKKLKDLNIMLSDIEESFVLGSGKGGQKVNKTANCVRLHHVPTGIRVSSQRSRERNQNRFFALRQLCEKIENLLSPKDSPAMKKIEKMRKQKKRRKRRHSSFEKKDPEQEAQ